MESEAFLFMLLEGELQKMILITMGSMCCVTLCTATNCSISNNY